MSINPKCHRCGSELKEFGAILLSPPSGKSVDKFHSFTLLIPLPLGRGRSLENFSIFL